MITITCQSERYDHDNDVHAYAHVRTRALINVMKRVQHAHAFVCAYCV